MSALKLLTEMVLESRWQKHREAPAYFLPKTKFEDRTAFGLTLCIVDYLNLSGYCATQLASTKICYADVHKLVGYQRRVELPDVFAIVNGHAVFVKIRVEGDQLSNVQKETISSLIAAGASVYIARDFQGFYDWFTALLPILSDVEALPFGPAAQR